MLPNSLRELPGLVCEGDPCFPKQKALLCFMLLAESLHRCGGRCGVHEELEDSRIGFIYHHQSPGISRGLL
jgi:hypothetical protein